MTGASPPAEPAEPAHSVFVRAPIIAVGESGRRRSAPLLGGAEAAGARAPCGDGRDRRQVPLPSAAERWCAAPPQPGQLAIAGLIALRRSPRGRGVGELSSTADSTAAGACTAGTVIIEMV